MLDTFASRNPNYQNYLFDNTRHHLNSMKKNDLEFIQQTTTKAAANRKFANAGGNGKKANSNNEQQTLNDVVDPLTNNAAIFRLNSDDKAIIFRNKPTSISFKNQNSSINSSKVKNKLANDVNLKKFRQSLYFPNSKYEFYKSITPTTTTSNNKTGNSNNNNNINNNKFVDNNKSLLNLRLNSAEDEDEKMDIYEISTVRSNSNLSSKFQKLVKLNDNTNKFIRKMNNSQNSSNNNNNSSNRQIRPNTSYLRAMTNRQKTFAEYGRSQTVTSSRKIVHDSESSLSDENNNNKNANTNDINTMENKSIKTSRSIYKENQSVVSSIKLDNNNFKNKINVERSKSSLERDYKKYKQFLFSDQQSLQKRLDKEKSSHDLKQASNDDNSIKINNNNINDSNQNNEMIEFYDSSMTNADLEHSKIKLKNNIQSSFLTYGSTIINPFISNFDIVNKSNPNFYKNISTSNGSSDYLNKRFNRANTSLSLISSLNQFRTTNMPKPNIISDSNNLATSRIETRKSAKNQSISTIQSVNNSVELTATIANKQPEQLTTTTSTVDKQQESFNNVEINTAANIIPMNAELQSDLTKLTSNTNKKAKNEPSDSAIKQNIFLSYRPVKKDSETDSFKKIVTNKLTRSLSVKHTKKSALTTNDSKAKSNDTKSDQLITDSPDMYVDVQTYNRIRNWLEEVERAQRIEGKWLETINKIAFYD